MSTLVEALNTARQKYIHISIHPFIHPFIHSFIHRTRLNYQSRRDPFAVQYSRGTRHPADDITSTTYVSRREVSARVERLRGRLCRKAPASSTGLGVSVTLAPAEPAVRFLLFHPAVTGMEHPPALHRSARLVRANEHCLLPARALAPGPWLR